ncbi:MAG TPA: DUF488 domain-containing protein [Acidimicrobiales bacterium]|nr:DUF488 domain-containing protein [Acidimicrobiales bacterium]
MNQPVVRIKRIYQPAEPDDGQRILVDRLWPRGVSRANAALDLWLPDVAPSSELRKWFGHADERWDQFKARFEEELRDNPHLLTLLGLANDGPMTLVYGAKNETHNQAVVLQEILNER